MTDSTKTDNLTQQELVLSSAPTELRRHHMKPVMEIFNQGANKIWVAIGSSSLCVVNKCRPISAQGSWALSAPSGVSVWAIAETADQSDGNGTICSHSEDIRL